MSQPLSNMPSSVIIPVSCYIILKPDLNTLNLNSFLDLFYCKKRFENSKMNPLVSLCTERSCFSNGGCRPFIIDTHLVRSQLFWVQIFVCLTHALPLKTSGTDFASLMAKISQEQAGFRRAEQLDLKGIFEHLQKVFKDARPKEQGILDNDMWIFTGKNQSKLRRDAIVSTNFIKLSVCFTNLILLFRNSSKEP